MKALLTATLLTYSAMADSQIVVPPSGAPAAAAASTLPVKGGILRAYVVDVVISTSDDSGPYTAFSIRPPEQNAQAAWFFIRNDDVTKSLERGAMIGLLIGAAEANRWSGPDSPSHLVNIRYETVRGRRIITDAALSNRLGAPN